ncbi:MAG TPA: FAD-binding oxidoreductase [Solirubrobacterales bacterium]|nr:FAD-binding oxidoreductase [Solirubrobacterales bacterium]
MTVHGRRRKHWGWGYEDQQPSLANLRRAAPAIRDRLGFGGEPEEPVALERIDLPPPRLRPPSGLAEIMRDDRHERVSHSLGKAYRDVVRGMRGRIDHPPDLVARPRDEGEVEAVLAWCADAGAAAIPFGGGTSVVGGVEPRLGDGYAGAVSVDLGALDRVLEVDPVSRAARVGAGVLGPALNEQLAASGLTLRHFPQSFELSTLGGWIATRAGGHYATVWTHIDDLVESVRAITPAGAWESRRVPGSGAGPSPDRMLIGSEGILGVITEAWIRVHERPRHKLSVGVGFDSFARGAAAVRELAQSGLNPANCRLLDPVEAEVTGAGPPGRALLVLGFESAHHPVDAQLEVALEAARDHGGEAGEVRGRGRRGAGDARRPAAPGRGAEEPAGGDSRWRDAFLAAPYLRDTLVACGVLTETLETAITWERFGEFHAAVAGAARKAAAEASGVPAEGDGAPKVSCRLTHVYPDGPAPYYTILAPAQRGSEVEQWDEVKAAVSEALIAAGGTITHHHAVGRDHRPWYDRQRPEPFAAALRAAKRAVDPAATLNPGVLIDP